MNSKGATNFLDLHSLKGQANRFPVIFTFFYHVEQAKSIRTFRVAFFVVYTLPSSVANTRLSDRFALLLIEHWAPKSAFSANTFTQSFFAQKDNKPLGGTYLIVKVDGC
jgi:hypothetical protein